MGAFYDGLDFGYWPDPTHWVRVSYDPSRLTVYVVDELRRYRTTDREFARLLMERRDVTASTEIICDSASEKPAGGAAKRGIALCRGRMKGARKHRNGHPVAQDAGAHRDRPDAHAGDGERIRAVRIREAEKTGRSRRAIPTATTTPLTRCAMRSTAYG